MVELLFHGAAGEVTGSMHMIRIGLATSALKEPAVQRHPMTRVQL